MNYSRYILGCVSKVSSVKCTAPLPYSKLRLAFKNFGELLDLEIRDTKSISVTTPAFFKHV